MTKSSPNAFSIWAYKAAFGFGAKGEYFISMNVFGGRLVTGVEAEKTGKWCLAFVRAEISMSHGKRKSGQKSGKFDLSFSRDYHELHRNKNERRIMRKRLAFAFPFTMASMNFVCRAQKIPQTFPELRKIFLPNFELVLSTDGLAKSPRYD